MSQQTLRLSNPVPLVNVADKIPDDLHVGDMKSRRHSAYIDQRVTGRLDIHLCHLRFGAKPQWGGHGPVVRVLKTKSSVTAGKIMLGMKHAADPEAFCRSWEKRYNVREPGKSSIHLDCTAATPLSG